MAKGLPYDFNLESADDITEYADQVKKSEKSGSKTTSGVFLIKDGEKIPVKPGAVKGSVEKMVVCEGSHIEFSGWAFDTENSLLPEVLISYDGKNIYWGQSQFRRPAVAEVYSDAALKSGFRFVLPLKLFEDKELNSSKMRLFAVSKGVASELLYIKGLIYYFLDNLESADIIAEHTDHVKKLVFSINDDPRDVLFQNPNSEVIFKDVPIYENAELQFGIGIAETVWNKEGNGVLFEISIVGENSQNILLFSQYIDPKNNKADRKWFDKKVNLSTLAGRKRSFIFKTSGGPKSTTAYDWAGWSNPQLTSLKKPEIVQIDFGTPEARTYMQNGWSTDEKWPDCSTFVWGIGQKSTLEFFLPGAREILIAFRCVPFQFPGSDAQSISIVVNGKDVAQVTLKPAPPAEYQIFLPSDATVPEKNRLEFRYAYARAPVDVIPGAVDGRPLAVYWDYINMSLCGDLENSMR